MDSQKAWSLVEMKADYWAAMMVGYWVQSLVEMMDDC
jgi:hypothetical protein